MNEERLTEKQEAFLTKNHIDSTGWSKDKARVRIGEIIDEINKDKPKTVDEQSLRPEVVKMYEKHARPVKEFHLTDEAIRSNALRCAIELFNKLEGVSTTIKGTMDLARGFEEYIRNGDKESIHVA